MRIEPGRLPIRGVPEGMNALVAGLEQTGCLAEAEYMNAELFDNAPREARSVHGFEVLGVRVPCFEDGTTLSPEASCSIPVAAQQVRDGR